MAWRFSDSATTPWPGNAASPCRMIGTAAFASRRACGPVRPGAAGLRRARGAEHDRVDVLEVRRVALEVDQDRVAVRELVGALRAVVVLDVAGAALGQRGDGLERRGALELGEDR